MLEPWPLLRTGPARPSLRVGLPWLACFLAWLVAVRLALDAPWRWSWWLWAAVGGGLVPGLAVIASLPLGVAARWRAVRSAAVAGLAGALAARALLADAREMGPFAILGGSAVAAAVAGVYALATLDPRDAPVRRR